jgi:hypothetical protein
VSEAQLTTAAPDAPADWHEGWRTGRAAAIFVLESLAHDTDVVRDRKLMLDAAAKLGAITAPPFHAPMPRADRLAAAIRAGDALVAGKHLDAARAVLQGALE